MDYSLIGVGRKVYDKEFLLSLRNVPCSTRKPDNIPVAILAGYLTEEHKNKVPVKKSKKSKAEDMNFSLKPMNKIKYEKEFLLSLRNIPNSRRKPDNIPFTILAGHLTKKDHELKEFHAKFQNIVDELDYYNIDIALEEVRNLHIDTTDKLHVVFDIILEKIYCQENFFSLAARFCSELCLIEYIGESEHEFMNIKKLLESRCKIEFKHNFLIKPERLEKVEEIKKCQNRNNKKLLKQELEDYDNNIKQRFLRILHFIGEIFKDGIFSAWIITNFLTSLFNDINKTNIEYMCSLLTAVDDTIIRRNTNLAIFLKKLEVFINDKNYDIILRKMIKNAIYNKEDNEIDDNDIDDTDEDDTDNNDEDKADNNDEYQTNITNEYETDFTDEDDNYNNVEEDPNKNASYSRLNKVQKAAYKSSGTDSSNCEYEDNEAKNSDEEMNLSSELTKLPQHQLKMKQILMEYINNHCGIAECTTNINSFKANIDTSNLVLEGWTMTLNISKASRVKMGLLFDNLIKSGTVALTNYCSGLEGILEEANYLNIDFPNIWEHVAEFIAPVMCNNLESSETMYKIVKLLSSTNHSPNILTCLFQFIMKEKRNSDVMFSDYITLNANIENKDVSLKSKLLVESEGTVLSPSRKEVKDSLFTNIENKMLTWFESDATFEDLIKWISENIKEDAMNDKFMRILATECFKNAIVESELKADKFQKGCTILVHFIDGDLNKELQCLFALQALMCKSNYTEDLFLNICEQLYENNIFSHESFLVWKSSSNPAEKDTQDTVLTFKKLSNFLSLLELAYGN